jgi:RNA polymerase sigma factor (sigma-70 family)
VKRHLTHELDRVVCKVAIREWRPHGPIELDDLKQIARMAALDALPKHNGSRTLPGFVANAARWRIKDAYRREIVERSHRAEHWRASTVDHDSVGVDPTDVLPDLCEDFTEVLIARLDAQRMTAALDRLAPAHREVLVQLYGSDRESRYREVAELLGLSIVAVKSLRLRALKEFHRQRKVAA